MILKTINDVCTLLVRDLEDMYKIVTLHRELDTISRNFIKLNAREVTRVVTIAALEVIILHQVTVLPAPEVVTVTLTELTVEELKRSMHDIYVMGISTRLITHMQCRASTPTTTVSNCRPQLV